VILQFCDELTLMVRHLDMLDSIPNFDPGLKTQRCCEKDQQNQSIDVPFRDQLAPLLISSTPLLTFSVRR
jgi:hypothetical protein